jgi:hypothetical protein
MLQQVNRYQFNKEPDGKWYIVLPNWTGNKSELEMVEGADKMLDYVSSGANEVVLALSEQPFFQTERLILIHDYSQQTGGGGIYLLKNYDGKTLNQEMWLCKVTGFVFGKLPPVIYFKKA